MQPHNGVIEPTHEETTVEIATKLVIIAPPQLSQMMDKDPTTEVPAKIFRGT